MKVTVDDDKCCGAGQCVLLAPDVFDQNDEDGIVALRDSQPPQSRHASVREAANMCPTGTITVIEEA